MSVERAALEDRVITSRMLFPAFSKPEEAYDYVNAMPPQVVVTLAGLYRELVNYRDGTQRLPMLVELEELVQQGLDTLDMIDAQRDDLLMALKRMERLIDDEPDEKE
jgi:hypothetical protein